MLVILYNIALLQIVNPLQKLILDSIKDLTFDLIKDLMIL